MKTLTKHVLGYGAAILIGGGGIGERHLSMRQANFAKENFKAQLAEFKETPYYAMVTHCELRAHDYCLDEFFHYMEDEVTQCQMDRDETETRYYRLEENFGEAVTENQNKAERIESLRLELEAFKENAAQECE